MGKKKIFLGATVFFLFALSLTLLLSEVFIRAISSRSLIYNIEMVRYATLLKMADPEGIVSHVHRPNSSGHLMGVDVALNNLGNRGPQFISEKPKDVVRLFVLGSSVTMGWGVAYPQVFTSVLQKRLNEEHPFGSRWNFQIENSGIGNYNTFFQYRLFQRQYRVVKPNMVILNYFISDVEPRSKGNSSWIFRHSYLATYLHSTLSSIAFLFSEKKDLYDYYSDFYQDENVEWKKTQGYISEILNITRADNVPLVIAIIPDVHNLQSGSRFKDLYEKIQARFQAMGIPTINSFDSFQSDFGGKEELLWVQEDDPHPNALGHALMAKVFYEYLVAADPLHLKSKK